MPYKYNSCFPQLPNGHFSYGILWQTVSAFFCNSVFYLVISMDIPGEMKFQSAKVLQKTPRKQILQKKMSLGKRPAVAIHGNMEIVQQKCPNGCFSSSRKKKTLKEIHDSIEQCRKNVQMDGHKNRQRYTVRWKQYSKNVQMAVFHLVGDKKH